MTGVIVDYTSTPRRNMSLNAPFFTLLLLLLTIIHGCIGGGGGGASKWGLPEPSGCMEPTRSSSVVAAKVFAQQELQEARQEKGGASADPEGSIRMIFPTWLRVLSLLRLAVLCLEVFRHDDLCLPSALFR